jgi:hypothetical protein
MQPATSALAQTDAAHAASSRVRGRQRGEGGAERLPIFETKALKI